MRVIRLSLSTGQHLWYGIPYCRGPFWFLQELKIVFPNAQRINRGGQVRKEDEKLLSMLLSDFWGTANCLHGMRNSSANLLICDRLLRTL